jgi:hypothetical protein
MASLTRHSSAPLHRQPEVRLVKQGTLLKMIRRFSAVLGEMAFAARSAYLVAVILLIL